MHHIDEALKQYSALITILNYICLGHSRKTSIKSHEYLLHVGRVEDFGDLRIDVYLDVQGKGHSQILYLIDYIVYGFHLRYEI